MFSDPRWRVPVPTEGRRASGQRGGARRVAAEPLMALMSLIEVQKKNYKHSLFMTNKKIKIL